MPNRRRKNQNNWLDSNPDFVEMLKITIGLLVVAAIVLLFLFI